MYLYLLFFRYFPEHSNINEKKRKYKGGVKYLNDFINLIYNLFCPDCVHLISIIIVYVVINFLLHLKHLKNNVKGSNYSMS